MLRWGSYLSLLVNRVHSPLTIYYKKVSILPHEDTGDKTSVRNCTASNDKSNRLSLDPSDNVAYRGVFSRLPDPLPFIELVGNGERGEGRTTIRI
jgi:hypothetical protein